MMPLAALASMSLPSVLIAATALASTAISLFSRKIAPWERAAKAKALAPMILAWISILIPVAGHAVVLVSWGMNGGLNWPWVVAGIISSNVMCIVLLRHRTYQQLACLWLSWGIIAIGFGSFDAVAALIAAGVFITLVGRYQIEQDRVDMVAAQARERERNRAEDILRDYEETGQGWFWETDRRGLLTYLSPSVIAVLKRPPSAILGKPFIDLFDLNDDNRDGERTLTFHLSARSSFQELGTRAVAPGEERWWSVSGRPAYDSFQNFVGFRGSGTDLTEKKRSAENVNRLAQYDSLTGLANRFQMQQTLEKILKAPLEQHRECSVFLLDLDRFKHVNDTLGHPAGDALLKQVADRLTRSVGKQGRVGRLGGDEFEVIIHGRSERQQLAQLAHEIIHALSQPYSIEGQRVVIGASIGIAVAPANGETNESLVRNSDLALYAAKDGGRGRYHFYSNDLHSAAEERSKVEEDLRDAIANGSLELFYQPVVCSHDDTIAGFEALLRWNHPTRGWLSPSKFIHIAEDTGLISAIGEWAIRTACNDLAQWPENIRCAVNVSPVQFSNPQLPSIITNAVARSGIAPSRLELEITESVFLNDDEGTDAMFTALKRVGVRLALDDFGTGYSSLGYLKKAPFDKIKIDQSFVRGATEPGSRNGAIITSITSLAKALGMDTTAEGVETLDELDLVRKLGCSHVQGYIYSKAVNTTAIARLLASGPQMKAQGYRSARGPRQTMLRKVMLETGGQFYNAKIRNIGLGGAMIEGLWNVPPGTTFNVAFSASKIVSAVSIWSEDDRMGVQFSEPLDLEADGLPRNEPVGIPHV
ncbi:EAL domain-containing protein [Altererythrobacter gangjinensis]|uniref:EAL domain-containing protein n=2 Tax=Pontixanthobacter gangjinensis TaxID=1028742 RepID=A0A6I4SN11_9SPHN|nr:EAL domain-containing protein [Pontixanthobacter gangjinensis]